MTRISHQVFTRRPASNKRLTVFLLTAFMAAGSAACSKSTGSDAASSSSKSKVTIVNRWSGHPVDLTKLPLGNTHVSTSTPSVGGLWACDQGIPGIGAHGAAEPWIDEKAGTWDATKKPSVQGYVGWPSARYEEVVSGGRRTISTNGLPGKFKTVKLHTGTFPISSSDPVHKYDGNPNHIAKFPISMVLPLRPKAAASPSCLNKASIGILSNGVALFAPIDESNRDAVATEVQDTCSGHPQQASEYHYHDISTCILALAKGPSTVVGFAFDGFPIVVERDAAGQLPTNGDLDECHGRTSPILLDGKVQTVYHYSATREFPYVVGCFHGTPR